MRIFSRHIFEISAIILVAVLLWAPFSPVSGAPSNNQASVVITALPAYTPPSGGGGNGGSGGSDGNDNSDYSIDTIPPDSTKPDPLLSENAISLAGIINSEGIFTRDIIIESNNNQASLFISAGTVGLVEETTVPNEISIVEITEVPAIPSNGSEIVGTVYDIGTSGLEFDNPVSLTLYYEDSWIPTGVSEIDLYIAVDEDLGGDWKPISNSKVDPVNNKVTAMIEHFSAFTIMADIELSFELSKLEIYPATITSGETVSVSVLVTNSNDTEATRAISLMVNGQPEVEKEVTLTASESRTVTFDTSRQEAGEYTVTIGELKGTFMVKPVSTEVPDILIQEEPPVNPVPEEPPANPTLDEPPVSPVLPDKPVDPAQPEQSASFIFYITFMFAVIAVAIISWYFLRWKRRDNSAETDGDNIS